MLSATCTGIWVARVLGTLINSKDFFLNLGFMILFGKYLLRSGNCIRYCMMCFLKEGVESLQGSMVWESLQHSILSISLNSVTVQGH